MANLKEELNQYLARNDTPKNGASMSAGLKTLGKLFKKSESEDNEDLLTNNQKYFYHDFCPSLTRMQRITGFCICVFVSAFFFGLSLLYIPVIILKARKFALMFTIASCSFLCSFSFLWGPVSYLKHLFSVERLPFTAVYISSLLATLYFSIWLKSTPLTALSAVIQIISLVWFLVTYIPGGQTGLSFFRRVFTTTVTTSVSKTLPV